MSRRDLGNISWVGPELHHNTDPSQNLKIAGKQPTSSTVPVSTICCRIFWFGDGRSLSVRRFKHTQPHTNRHNTQVRTQRQTTSPEHESGSPMISAMGKKQGSNARGMHLRGKSFPMGNGGRKEGANAEGCVFMAYIPSRSFQTQDFGCVCPLSL